MLRTYSRYLQQIRFGFSQSFISDTLVSHPDLSRLLLRCFEARFDTAGNSSQAARLQGQILRALEDAEIKKTTVWAFADSKC